MRRPRQAIKWCTAILLLVTCHWSLITLNAAEPTASGIQDNSFLVEEAYNQEPGVVQHIINVPVFFSRGEKEITPTFTQEWPVFSQTHQLSYTLPYVFTDIDNGFADVRLNYRLQALNETESCPALAPRLTLVLPTGDSDFGLGHTGFETNLPFSKIVSDRWTVHFNAGMSIFPDMHDRDLINYTLGASAIYAVSRDFNLMLEAIAGWNEDVDPAGATSRETVALISPGARYAINLPGDLQIVSGAAIPIGVTSDSPDWGMFFYLSFEHPFVHTSEKARE